MLERAVEAFRLRVVDPLRRRCERTIDERAPRLAERLYGAADAVAFLPFRTEVGSVPQPVQVGTASIQTADDLAAFTGLSREIVVDLLRRRRDISFRSEWLGTPERLRVDRWFYLSSRSYLFANAVHFPDESFVDRYITPHVPPGGRVLDFGGGTGELAIRCAARGLAVTYVELNALQRDFVRFRIWRHGLQRFVTVLDPWEDPEAGQFAAVIAVDVLEHLDDAPAILDGKLLPALAPAGVFIEDSPFVVSSANPMHHDDFGLESFLAGRGMRVAQQGPGSTRVWRRTEAPGRMETPH